LENRRFPEAPKLGNKNRFSLGRLHLFELEDQSWFPRVIPDAGTDFMRFVAEVAKSYGTVVARLERALGTTGSQEILDLCSGGAGPVMAIRDALAAGGNQVPVTLTDKFPNRAAFEYAKRRSDGGVSFIGVSIDATAVPSDLPGFRTLFCGLHHFRPDAARRILQNAVDQRRPIGVFEITQRNLVYIVGSLLLPLALFLSTPFIRPFRWGRLFWTYVILVVPAFLTWDAFVSCLRTYSPKELRELLDGLNCEGYAWDIGVEADRLVSIFYLIGYPNRRAA
jgi:hypothetical protein